MFCLFVQNPKVVLFIILVGIIITTYQQFDNIREEIKQVRSKNEGVPQIENTLKNIQNKLRLVDRLEEDLRDFEAEVKKLNSEIKLYKRDKTGLVDYAYGGHILSIRGTETYVSEGLKVLGFRMCGQPYLENRILQKSAMPGDCWPIRGHEGAAVIKLIDDIVVTKVSLEHVPRELVPNGTVTSAPKTFSLWGLHDNGSPDHLLGQFVYDAVSGPEVQTFCVLNPTSQTFRVVEFKVHSNHGHPDFTCIYRVRIHGHKP